MFSTEPPNVMRRPPWLIGLMVLGIVFSAEFVVMLIMPLLLPKDSSLWFEALVDAVLLSLIVSPLIWWAIVCPLKNLNQVRARFISAVLTSQEEDRRHIARELHDSVGQSLTLLVTSLRSWPSPNTAEQLQRISDLTQVSQQTLRDIRDLSQLMRPSLLDDLGLAAAMERVMLTVQRHHAFTFRFSSQPSEFRRLDANVETALFRIFQEAVNNAIKHSGASELCIELKEEAGKVSMKVEDNGKGIPRSVLNASKRTGIGIIGMHERANQLGGKLTIDTDSHGTRVSVIFVAKVGV